MFLDQSFHLIFQLQSNQEILRLLILVQRGHAGLGSKVSVSPDWIVVEKSDENFDLKTSLDHSTYEGEFVYIEELNAIHAGVRASQGSFSLPFDGWPSIKWKRK